MQPSSPANENLRVQDLESIRLLDSAPCESFDNLTRLCQHLFKVEMAAVSLVDSDRQWFKSAVGLPVCETKRNISFCTWVVADNQHLLVNDTFLDERFKDNPLVIGAPFIRFYSGIPLYSRRKMLLGTLCILHSKPRSMTQDEITAQFLLAKQAEALIEKFELGQLAVTDSLTGIHNRRYFNDRSREAVSAASRTGATLSVIVFDIDDFKRVNDNYGHSVGDQALIAIAKCVQAQIRKPDVISRVGGEEFHVLLPETGVRGALNVATRLRDAIRASSISAAGEAIRLTCSFGIAHMEKDDTHIDSILQRADAAMYAAKREGKDRVVCDLPNSATPITACR